MLEKTLESPLDCKEIQWVHPKGDQSWVFIGRNDVEAETPILSPPDGKNWPIVKDPHDGKDWGQEEKGTIEDEMAGWHHWLNGQGFWWTPGVDDGQGRPGMLQFMGSQRVGHDQATELYWTELGDIEGQGSQECNSPWHRRAGHDLMAEQNQQQPKWSGKKKTQCPTIRRDRTSPQTLWVFRKDNQGICGTTLCWWIQ